MSIIFFCSCDRNYTFTYPNTAEVHEQVFGIDDTIPSINIDFSINLRETFNQIDSNFSYDICHLLVPFKHKLSSNKPIKFFIIKDCPILGIPCSFGPEFRINLNSSGQIMINSELVSNSDQIPYLMVTEFPQERYSKHWVEIKWMTKTPVDTLEKVFQQVRFGYLKTYQKMAKEKFENRSFYNITQSERDSILSELPFRIVLDVGRFGYPSPPLPRNELPTIISSK
ncbi:MAG: hypothetical protein AB8B72_05405 [Crocinitomicaceae bacterium]